MKKTAKFLIGFCIAVNAAILFAIIWGLVGEGFAGDFAHNFRMILRIAYPIVSIYLSVFLLKFINKEISLNTLIHKISEFFIVFGIAGVIINMITQYIETGVINALFTDMNSFVFLVIGIVIKLILQTQEEKGYEMSSR